MNLSGVKIYFASTKHIQGDVYESVGNSRLFAIVAESDSMEKAREKIYKSIEGNVEKVLHYRKDIGKIYKH